MNKYSFEGLSWWTNKIKNETLTRGKIITDEDYENLYSLSNYSDFTNVLLQFHINLWRWYYEKSADKDVVKYRNKILK